MEIPNLPNRIFHDREEPNGDRVNQYFKLNTVQVVQKALLPEELELIKPAFGKLLNVYAKPIFSGKLAHFLLTRQLNVAKRHEIWFIFAGKPVRFGLREFGIVTGLDCSPIPTMDRDLLKSPPGVTPYWFTLFGGEEFVTGEMLLAKLRRPKSLSPELRIKYACLLLVDGLLCRRSFHMKIPKEHVEMIRDLDVFLKYPWGRFSFDMTMQSIKSRTVNQLAQPTVAVRGFIHALQLVFIEAVPGIMAAVGDKTDPESGCEDAFPVISLKLDKVWDLDGEEEVEVISLIESDGASVVGTDFSWDDEINDEKVDAMVEMIGGGIQFCRDMFVGGRRRAVAPVVAPTRTVRNEKRKGKAKVSSASSSIGESSRAKKTKTQTNVNIVDLISSNPQIMEFVDSLIQVGMKTAQGAVYATIRADMVEMEDRIQKNVKDDVPLLVDQCIKTNAIVGAVLKDVTGVDGNPYEAVTRSKDSDCPPGVVINSVGKVNNSKAQEGGNLVEAEITLGGDTQDDVPCAESTEDDVGGSEVVVKETAMQPVVGSADSGKKLDSVGNTPSNKKFIWMSTNIDPKREFPFAHGLILNYQDLLAIPSMIPPERPEVMDACVFVMRDSLFSNVDPATDHRAEFLPSKFAVSLAITFAKFKKTVRKEAFEFEADLIEATSVKCSATGKKWLEDIDFFYFPFNIDKNRWIAVMVDMLSHSLTVFDSTAESRRGSRLKPELEFICEMFPYVARKIGGSESGEGSQIKPLSFSRNTAVAQASDKTKTGMLMLLFMEAHATGGLEKVYLVNEECIGARAEQLAVEMYEHCCGDIE